jgi:hypothetical protein
MEVPRIDDASRVVEGKKMSENGYDRSAHDVGNILAMEHVNVTIPNQEVATLFYATGLGLTRDPYMMVGPENMWMNVGQQQFHLPTRDKAQVLRGLIGIVMPDLEALKQRLMAVQPKLAGTSFSCSAENGHVDVTCPWGNRIRTHHLEGGEPAYGNPAGQWELFREGVDHKSALVGAGRDSYSGSWPGRSARAGHRR